MAMVMTMVMRVVVIVDDGYAGVANLIIAFSSVFPAEIFDWSRAEVSA